MLALFLRAGFRAGDGILRIEDREVGQRHRHLVPIDSRRDLDGRDVVEDDLIPFDGAFVEDLRRDVLGRDVDALIAGFLQDVGEQPHLELEPENIDAGDVLLAALQDDLFDEQPRHRQVDRSHRDQPSCPLSLKRSEAVGLLGAVGTQDQINEGSFLLFELLFLLCFS